MPNDKEFELDDLESFSFDDLSLDDAPSSDADPAPASGEDPFGVWVKSAPEDVDASAEAEAPAAESDGLPEEDFLSTEELANLDDSFDFVTVDEPLEGETPEDEPLEDEIAFLDTPEAVAAEKAAPEGASFDEVSLDDFVSFDDVTTDESPVADALAEAETEEDPNEEFLDIDIDIEDDIGDEELEIIEGAAPRAEVKEAAPTNFAAQDVDLSEFGDFEEVAAGPLASSDDLPEVDLPDLPDMADLPDMDDLTPPDEMGLADLPGEEDTEEGFFEETVLDESLPTLEDEGPVSLDLEPDDQTDLDHIMALEEDLTAGIRDSDAPAAAASTAASNAVQDVAAAILGKIEQELSSIKQEITALKNEVTHLRAAPEAAPAPFEAPAEAPASAEEPHAQPRGFFDEEEDETIALTGDELDNLFSSAEISESEEQGETLDDDLIGMDAEGNLIEPPAEAVVEDDLHVSDEEFLAGTSLDLNAPDPLADAVADAAEAAEISDELGIPDSIELEDSLPLELDEGATEDLLGIDPLPPGVMEASPEPLEIPFDEDIDLADESAPLAPELTEPASEAFNSLDSIDSLPEIDLDVSDGWSPPALDDEVLAIESEPAPLELEPEPVAAPVAPAPAPAPTVPSGGPAPLPANLKTELKAVLQYMDKLLASLPDDKIQEFAESEHFEVYKRLFEELGLIE